MAAVYGVPDARTGDQVMAAVELHEGAEFDPAAFGEFLAGQAELGTKWAPRYVRIVERMPLTANNKVNKQGIRPEARSTGDPVFWRPDRELDYRPLTDADRDAIAAEFEANGRSAALPG